MCCRSYCCSVAKLCPTQWNHGQQPARLLCPLWSFGVCSNSCPLSQWYLTISSSAAPFSFLPSIFPMSRLFASGGQRNGGSASATVLPMNIQSGFPLGLTGLISLQSRGNYLLFNDPLENSPDRVHSTMISTKSNFKYIWTAPKTNSLVSSWLLN